MEQWRDVKGYEGLYQVSNYGRVKSLHKKTEKIKSQRMGSNGYKVINLYKNGIEKTYGVHRLVAMAFIDNHDNKREVNHIDGCKINNCVENLEWATPSENIRHAYDTGLNEGTSKASEARKRKVKCITTGKTYESLSEAESLTGVAYYSISKCCTGKKKSAGKLPDGTKLIWEYI